jgi:LuxR family maltose regulon positive regulatory protein
VHAETYDMSGARQHLQRAAELVRPEGDAMQAVMLTIVGARVHRAAGDIPGAMAVLVEAQSGERVTAWLSDRLRVEQAALEIRSGEPERALAVVKDLAETENPDASLVLAQARLASGEDLARPIPAPRASLTARVDGLLLEAWRRLRQGEEPGAVSALDRSLRLAAPERLRRPFREAPRDVRQLMRHHEDLTRQHSWLSADRAAMTRPVPAQRGMPHPEAETKESALIVEPLTEKEREVLGHLAELLTTEEIAAAMFVSVNTVRTHVRNILRKMSASRRNEAVRRAYELHILPSPPYAPPSHQPVRSPAGDEAGKRRSAHR